MLFLFLQKLCENKGAIVQSPKLKNLAFALCLAFLPSSVLAAGLGKLNVMSGLGEPLKADIELLSVTPEELSSITASIASSEAYTNQGIEKPASHNDIKIQVTKNARGVPVLKLNSAQPITDAFLDLLIQVDWSSGRLLREYTLLLDPPGYNSEAQTSTAKLPATSATANESASTNAITTAESPVGRPSSSTSGGATQSKKPATVKPESTQAGETATNNGSFDTSQEYTTQKGDNLAKIAQDMKPEGVSLEQMLVGLYQTNPKAFDGKNMNRLKVGQIIRAPSAETLESTTKKSASKEVRVHSANWNEYKNKLAGIVADSQGTEDAAPTQSSSGKVMAAEDKATPPVSGTRDVVKLSGADASKGNASDKALQDKLIALQEEATAKDNALKESQSRASDLEKQIEDMKNLMALKSDAMAKMQNDAATQANPDVANVPPADSAAQVPATNPPVEAVATVEPPPAVDTPPTTETAQAKQVTPPPPAPMQIEQPSLLDGVAQNVDMNTLGFAGGALALLGAGWLYLRNKRKKNLTSFEEGIMTSGGLKANTVFGNTAGGTVDTGDTSFLTDFSQSTNGGMIDSHDVDPIAEAEVYMAYGRDAQAEEILKDAIVKEPKRYELHLKLLEIYQTSGNTSAFETISGELYTTLGASDPVWAKVAQLGIKMDPDNPLYKVEEQPQNVEDGNDFELVGDAVSTDKDDFFASFGNVEDGASETMLDSPSAEEKLDLASNSTTISNVVEPSPFDLDLGALDFDMDTPTQEVREESDQTPTILQDEVTDHSEDVLSFNNETTELDDFSDDLPAENAENSMMEVDFDEAPKSLDVPTIDFPNFSTADNTIAVDESNAPDVFDENEPSLPEVIEIEADETPNFDIAIEDAHDLPEPSDLGMSMAEPPSFDLTDINLDLNDLSGDGASQSAISAVEPEEVETKLDLVMAYLDMEDKIGAKELLEEVLKEGGENQRRRASELLEKIG
jgi:pilus assembly protein FimV